jgi:hypothetical protein
MLFSFPNECPTVIVNPCPLGRVIAAWDGTLKIGIAKEMRRERNCFVRTIGFMWPRLVSLVRCFGLQ